MDAVQSLGSYQLSNRRCCSVLAVLLLYGVLAVAGAQEQEEPLASLEGTELIGSPLLQEEFSEEKRAGGRNFQLLDEKRAGGRSFQFVGGKRAGGRNFLQYADESLAEGKRGGGRAFVGAEELGEKRGGGRSFQSFMMDKKGGGRTFQFAGDKRGGGRAFVQEDEKRGGGRNFQMLAEDKRGGGRSFQFSDSKRGGGRAFVQEEEKRGGGRNFQLVEDKRGGGRGFQFSEGSLADQDKRGGGRAFRPIQDFSAEKRAGGRNFLPFATDDSFEKRAGARPFFGQDMGLKRAGGRYFSRHFYDGFNNDLGFGYRKRGGARPMMPLYNDKRAGGRRAFFGDRFGDAFQPSFYSRQFYPEYLKKAPYLFDDTNKVDADSMTSNNFLGELKRTGGGATLYWTKEQKRAGGRTFPINDEDSKEKRMLDEVARY